MKRSLPSAGFVYLASQSPRRRELLAQIGVEHRLLVAGPEEDAEALEAERANELPAAYVERVTRAKLRAARQRLAARGLPAAPILCADTTVALGRRILGKPADAADAARTLALLSGRTHRVITAVAVAWVGAGAGARAGPTAEAMARNGAGRPPTRLLANVSHVRFVALSARQIDRYVASGEPFGKAGAYAIQSRAAAWIERIDGSYTAIMGLPLHETATLLAQVGLEVGP